MHLNSQNGSINVLLVNHDTKTDTAVVVQVPPPEDNDAPMNALPPTRNSATPEIKGPVVKDEIMEEKLPSMFPFMFAIEISFRKVGNHF